jgi:hypothetical protein
VTKRRISQLLTGENAVNRKTRSRTNIPKRVTLTLEKVVVERVFRASSIE